MLLPTALHPSFAAQKGMSWLQALYVLILPFLLPPASLASSGDLHPLVVVPGQSTNQIEARLTEDYAPSDPACRARGEKGWFRLWMDVKMLAGPSVGCFAEQMTLRYDSGMDDYRNTPGVETRVPYFGSTRGFLYKDPESKPLSPYTVHLVKQLEQIGYTEGTNLFGAPYDFRYGLAADHHPSLVGSKFLQDLKELVEEASRLNGNKPVIILTHSLGGLFALHLLNRNPPWWRQRYVRHLIALSAPWGGTVVEMRIFASGDNLGFPASIDPLSMRREIRSLESNLWLLPHHVTFGGKPLVVTRDRNYSASDVAEFLTAIGYAEGAEPYEARIRPMTAGRLAAPGVPVTCMFGHGVDTHEVLVYGGEGGFDEQPEVVYGDGDQLVNLASLSALESQWSGLMEQVLKVVRLHNVSHASILTDRTALEEVVREILDVNSLELTSSA